MDALWRRHFPRRGGLCTGCSELLKHLFYPCNSSSALNHLMQWSKESKLWWTHLWSCHLEPSHLCDPPKEDYDNEQMSAFVQYSYLGTSEAWQGSEFRPIRSDSWLLIWTVVEQYRHGHKLFRRAATSPMSVVAILVEMIMNIKKNEDYDRETKRIRMFEDRRKENWECSCYHGSCAHQFLEGRRMEYTGYLQKNIRNGKKWK